MPKEIYVEPSVLDSVTEACKELSQPWIKSGMPLPRTTILELSRITRIPSQKVSLAISSGKIILNGVIEPQQAVLNYEGQTIGDYSNQVSADIWAEGQRYQRRKQFPDDGSTGKPTSRKINILVMQEWRNRTRVDFKPTEKTNTEKKTLQKETTQQKAWILRAEKKQEVMENPVFSFMDKNSKFPLQNPMSLRERLRQRAEYGLPIKIGCFVCLPGEWVNIDGQPRYQIDTTGNTLSRLEQPEFVERTKQLLVGLEKTGVDFNWDFLIADTDPDEVFGQWLAPDQNIPQSVYLFQSRISAKFKPLMPDKVDTILWSSIQSQSAEGYKRDFKYARELAEVELEIQERYPKRREYYKTMLERKGFTVTNEILNIFALQIPRRNSALYGAQGPLVNDNFDLLVIADADPVRLAEYQSLLAKDLNIWFPYRG